MGLRELILDRLAARPVPFEYGGVSAFLKVWTAAERRSFLRDHKARGDDDRFAERLVAACLCDAAGALVFGPDEAELVGEELDGAFVGEAADRAFALNRLGGDDPKAAAPSGATPS